jgi:hypothetical protein
MKNILALILLMAAGSCSKEKNVSNEIRLSLASEIPTIDPASCYDTVCGPVVTNSY